MEYTVHFSTPDGQTFKQGPFPTKVMAEDAAQYLEASGEFDKVWIESVESEYQTATLPNGTKVLY